jgi:hypothetical protein
MLQSELPVRGESSELNATEMTSEEERDRVNVEEASYANVQAF